MLMVENGWLISGGGAVRRRFPSQVADSWSRGTRSAEQLGSTLRSRVGRSRGCPLGAAETVDLVGDLGEVVALAERERLGRLAAVSPREVGGHVVSRPDHPMRVGDTGEAAR